MTDRQPLWAIKGRFDWGIALLGVGCFGWPATMHTACTTALFSTRKVAREHAKRIPGASVIRVMVTVKPQ